MATHCGEILVDAIGAGTEEDPQRPDIVLADGEKWEDTTGVPSEQYLVPPGSMVIRLYADEAKFLALGDDVLWYDAIPQEVA